MVPIVYNLRSLAVRKTTTLATAGGVALVVFVFAAVLMLSEGVKRTLGRSGSDDIAIVLRDGSDAELSSGIEAPQIALITAPSEVKRRGGGAPDAAAEIVAVLSLDKVGTDGQSNAQIRGVPDDVMSFRPSVRLVAGRVPRPGADEAMIGNAIRGRFRGLDMGQSFEIRKNRNLTVVGVFEDGGSSYESEIWAGRDQVQSALGRGTVVSSVRVRLRSRDVFERYQRQLQSNRQLGVDVMRESDYYAKQSEGLSIFINALGILVAFFFSVGAVIGAMITMHASVANRSREIGTLRALGFKRWQILLCFLLESSILALVGGLLGAAASLSMALVRFPMVNFASWSEIVFTFEPTPGVIIASLVVAVLMGLVGGFLPAVRAARADVLSAIRA
ncbi:MAG: ABC transporter permease [Deltaproteobacteria bacterium]|nr:ABC transporter permease [Deltaproteobacteria bacterium]